MDTLNSSIEVNMTTFVLKKYAEKEETNENLESKEEKDSEEMTITVVGSVSEIVAKALNKVLDKQLEIKQQEDNASSDVKAISTEDINTNPVDTFNSIKPNDVVFIHNNGFKTKEEEWFLTNIGNKTQNVFYTVESFIKFIQKKLNLK